MAKKVKVKNLFDNIASDYDRLNHLLSLNIDTMWRRRAAHDRRLGVGQPRCIQVFARIGAAFSCTGQVCCDDARGRLRRCEASCLHLRYLPYVYRE